MITASGSRDPAKSRQEYVTKANALLETAHYREAVIEYRNALKVDGRFGPARLGLARALEETGRTRQVIVFTHDERLPEAVRRLVIKSTILSITRRPKSGSQDGSRSH